MSDFLVKENIGVQNQGQNVDNDTANTQTQSHNNQQASSVIDEEKMTNAFTNVFQKFFGKKEVKSNAENNENTPQQVVPQNVVNYEEQFKKLQATLEEANRRNTILLDKQKLQDYANELKDSGFDIDNSVLRTVNNISELKRKILQKEMNVDYSAQNDDYVNGVFDMLAKNKSIALENNKNVKTMISRIVSENAGRQDKDNFQADFLQTDIKKSIVLIRIAYDKAE